MLGNSKVFYYLCNMENIENYKQYSKIQCVYRILDIAENKSYVGGTMNLQERIGRHLSCLKRNTHHSKKFQDCFNKTGIDNFKVEILEYGNLMNSQELHDVEIMYIKKFNSIENGFNNILNSKKYKKFKQTPTALNNFIKARSIPLIGINLLTKEKIQFISISEAAKYIDDQSTNISKQLTGKLRYVKNFVFIRLENYDETIDYTILRKFNYNHSEETKLRQGKAQSTSKKVYKYDLNWKFVEEYYSRGYCERQHGMKKEYLRHKVERGTLIGEYWFTDKKR